MTTTQFPLPLALGLAAIDLVGQNLVPNSGFEDYNGDCAAGVGFQLLQSWNAPDCGLDPLYFNSCVQPPFFSDLPMNPYGFQHAHGGDGYCIVAPFIYDEGNPQLYMSIDLAQALVAGEQYCISLWLSLADSATFTTPTFHAFLWYGLPSICNYNDTAWDTYAVATFNTSLVDSVGWHLMQSSFTASGAESNLTLGCFSEDDELDTVQIGWHEWTLNFAGYYIDDVYLGDCAYAGVAEETSAHELSVFPNPALRGQEVTVRCSCTSKEHQWSIADLTGRAVGMVSRDRNAEAMTLSTVSLKPGAYMIQVDHLDGTRRQVPLVIH